MKKINLTFADLIEEMKSIVHNHGQFCLLDTITDLVNIARYHQEGEGMSQYWGVRRNGTVLSPYVYDMEHFHKGFQSEEKQYFRIDCDESGMFTIQSVNPF